MTNSPPPPPEPHQSPIGFDEWVGIIVALGTMGTILAVSLNPEDRGLNFLSRLLPSDTPTQPTPEATESPSPAPFPLPRLMPAETPSPQAEVPTTLPPGEEPIAASPAPTAPQRERKVTPLIPIPSEPTSVSLFSDIPEDFWAAPYILALAEQDILSGFPDNTFRPEQPLTRAEFASSLNKAFERKPTLSFPDFQDIPADFWASQAIQKTARTGFLRGYPDNTFQPTQEIPRVQALVALASGLGLQPSDDPDQVLQTYQDADQIPEYAKEEVAAATEAGLVVNYPNPQLLSPNEPASRADVAAWTYQALVAADQVEQIPSEYIVEPAQ